MRPAALGGWRAVALTVACVAAMPWADAQAQAASTAAPWPARPVRVVVPYTAGGPVDFIIRTLQPRLLEIWGQPVVIENRAGAGQIIGAEIVAKAPADGYTLLLPTGTYTTSVAIRTTLPFDPARDLTGVAMVGQGPLMLVVPPSLPFLPTRAVRRRLAVK